MSYQKVKVIKIQWPSKKLSNHISSILYRSADYKISSFKSDRPNPSMMSWHHLYPPYSITTKMTILIFFNFLTVLYHYLPLNKSNLLSDILVLPKDAFFCDYFHIYEFKVRDCVWEVTWLDGMSMRSSWREGSPSWSLQVSLFHYGLPELSQE